MFANFINLLAESTSATESGAAQASPNSNGYFLWILLGVLVIFLVWTFISGRKRRKQMEEETKKKNDIHPGYKVTTIGGIIGTVVEVDDEANTFVLETGTEDNKICIKFDKQAIYTSTNPFENNVSETATEEENKEEPFADVNGDAENTAEVAEPQNEETTTETEDKQ